MQEQSGMESLIITIQKCMGIEKVKLFLINSLKGTLTTAIDIYLPKEYTRL